MSWYDDEIKRLKSEQSREKQLEELRTGATTIRDVYQSFIDAGFTEEQAYELLTIQLSK